MTIADIGSLGEFVGSVAVLITLAYLAVQLRHTRAEVQRWNQEQRVQGRRELLSNRMSNESWQAAFVEANRSLGVEPSGFIKTLVDRSGITEEKARILAIDQLIQWTNWVEAIANASELEENDPRLEAGIRESYSSGVGQLFGERQKQQNVDEKAIRYVERVL